MMFRVERAAGVALLAVVMVGTAATAQERPAPAKDQDDYAGVSLERLLNIEITTASKSVENLKSAPGVVTVVTRADIESMGARSLADVLDLVPGFTVGRSVQSGFHTNLYVRGAFSLYSENVLFLVDGQRMNDGITGGGVAFIPDYPLDGVKQIEIIRGPGSALYGANAFVGVVNIVTLSGQEMAGGQATYRAGTNHGHLARLEYGDRTEAGLDYSLRGSLTRYDDNSLPQMEIRRFLVAANVPGFNQRFTGRINSEAVELYSFGAGLRYKGFGLQGGYDTSDNSNNFMTGAAASRSENQFRNRFETENYRLNSTYELSLTEELSVLGSGSYLSHASTSHYVAENLGVLSGTIYQDPRLAQGRLILIDWKTRTLDLNALVLFKPNDQHSSVAGIGFQRDDVTATRDRQFVADTNGDGVPELLPESSPVILGFIPESDRTVTAAFAQHTWAPSSRFSLTAGLRADRYSDFGSTLNPRAAVVFEPNARVSVKALVARAFRAPSIQELTRVVNGGVKPNPDLEPETLTAYELQVVSRPARQLSVAVAGYIYEIDDVIRQVPSGNPLSALEIISRNLGTRSARGVEIELRYLTARKVSVFANYSLVRSTDEFQGAETDVAGVPRQSLNLGGSVDLADKLSLSAHAHLRWEWTPQPPVPLPVRIPGLPPVQLWGELELPSFAVVNVRVALRNVVPRTTFTVEAFNLFDDQQVFPEQHSFAPGGVSVNGRQLLFGAQVRF